jgi:hypothetical protein
MAKKSWAEKMLNPAAPKIEVVEKPMSWAKAGDKLLIPTPVKIRDRVNRLGVGESLSVVAMREEFARELGADVTCPLCTGIFLRIVSEAAWEEHLAGAPVESVTPFWRVVEPGSSLAKKLACGLEWVREIRAREGIGG